jgi:hypothetical protein
MPMIYSPKLRQTALLAVFTVLTNSAIYAQLNSTNIAGTGVLQSTASFAAIISGNASTNGGTNSAIIGAANSIVPGGTRFAFIGAGNYNNMAPGSHSAAMLAGFSNAIVTGGVRGATVGGAFNTNAGRSAVILGGELNQIAVNSTGAAVVGGNSNLINFASPGSSILGGSLNIIDTASTNAAIGGGGANKTWGNYTAISGGLQNLITNYSTGSFIGGGVGNIVSSPVYVLENSPVTNPAVGTIAGGGSNNVAGSGGFIGGGAYNTNGDFFGTIAGGLSNTISSYNEATESSGSESFIGGGSRNTSTSYGGSIVGGSGNLVNGTFGSVGGGDLNTAGDHGAVGGGGQNTAGFYAVVPGGYANEASGDGAFAGGVLSRATNAGAFVWSGYYDDTETVTTTSTNDGSFTVRAPGGVRFITTTATNNLQITNAGGLNGVAVAPGGTAWVTLSDSNAKTAVHDIDPREVLAKVGHMPVTEWEYKHDPNRRYFGPMAQDFHAAFGLGNDDKTISTLDADGVLFLSVKGLIEEIKLRDAAIEDLKSKLESVEERLGSMLPPTRKDTNDK